MAIAPDGRPYVAWSDGSSGDSEIYIRFGQGRIGVVGEADDRGALAAGLGHHLDDVRRLA